MMDTRLFKLGVAALFCLMTPGLFAACHNSVVLVHGNTGSPSDFDNTRIELLARGYPAGQIFAPDWGSKLCAACNDHHGSEEIPVAEAIADAVEASCTGKIDVIGHSMGATLAARQIMVLEASAQVDTFVGIAGAFRGLWSCGSYPFNVMTSTCGAGGLSVNSPLVNSLKGQHFAARMYSMKSWIDQINCAGGLCTVGGVHTSSIDGEDGSLSYALGHFGLLSQTAVDQVDLIQ